MFNAKETAGSCQLDLAIRGCLIQSRFRIEGGQVTKAANQRRVEEVEMRADYSLKECDPKRMACLECSVWGGVAGSFGFLSLCV